MATSNQIESWYPSLRELHFVITASHWTEGRWAALAESGNCGPRPRVKFTRSLLLSISSAMANAVNETAPKKWGILALPRFFGLASRGSCPTLCDTEVVLQDVYGPLEILNIIGAQMPGMAISIIGETREPVPSHANSSTGVATSYLQPTYAIDEDPELDVLRTISSHLSVSR